MFAEMSSMKHKLMKTALLCWLIFGLSFSGCQSSGGAQKEPVEAQIQELFQEVDRIDSPGAAVAVLKDGEVVFSQGFGSAQLEYEIPITPETIFHVASVSKQFTAFAITLLAQEGKLSLEDDIRSHLPEVPDFGKTIRIHHLIHHTSGLRDQWEALAMAGWRLDDVITRDHILNMVKHQKELNFDPGERYLYCNTGYTLLAEIVARVTNTSFRTWTEQNIFKPLGMEHTHFHDDHEFIVENRAYSYSPKESGGFRKSVLSYANAGATSLFTTTADLLKWAQNFLEPKIGGPDVIEQMLELGVLNSSRKLPYAAGLSVRNQRSLRVISHGGSDAGFRTWLGIFPEQDFAVCVLCNLASLSPNQLGQQIAELYLDAEMSPVPQKKASENTPAERQVADVDPMTFEIYTGRYLLDDGSILEISKENDRLFAKHPSLDKSQLFPETIARYFLKDADVVISFRPDENYYVERLFISMEGRRMRGRRLKSKPLTKSQLQALEGEYYSPELETTYTIASQDGSLVAQHFRHGEIPLLWTENNTFTGRRWFFRKVEFQRDPKGRIFGFLLTGGRVWNLRFHKR
jgi:CubicO group peptidase (beta-lactamase class C family)